MKTVQSLRDADGSLWAGQCGARWVTGRRALLSQAPIPAGLGASELCGSGAPALPPEPDVGWSSPAGYGTPSWVKVQPQGSPLASKGREPLTTGELPLPTQGANTYSTGFAVERGGGRRTEGMERKGGKQRWGWEWVPPTSEAPGKPNTVWQPEGGGPQRWGAGGGRGRVLDPRQLGPR